MIRLPVQLNASGDWCCPACGGTISVEETAGDVRDISAPSQVSEGQVTSAAWNHQDGCAALREACGSGRV